MLHFCLSAPVEGLALVRMLLSRCLRRSLSLFYPASIKLSMLLSLQMKCS